MITKLVDCFEVGVYKVEIWKGAGFDIVLMENGDVLHTTNFREYAVAKRIFDHNVLEINALVAKTSTALQKTFIHKDFKVSLVPSRGCYKVESFLNNKQLKFVTTRTFEDANKYFSEAVTNSLALK